MAGRRRRKEQPSVSLFPFLSILACVIGVLTLMISALALGQMESPPDDPEVQKRDDDHKQALRGIEEAQAEIQRLLALIAQAEQTRSDLEDAMQGLSQLETQFEDAKKKQQSDFDLRTVLLAQVEELKKIISSLEIELSDNSKETKSLNTEIAKRTAPPPEAVVQVRPSGTGRRLVANFIECRKLGLMIHEGLNPKFVRLADVKRSAEFIGLLDRVSRTKKGTVIFLVRDDAVRTYYLARGVARAHFCRNGKLPVVGHGNLDLSIFRKKLKSNKRRKSRKRDKRQRR